MKHLILMADIIDSGQQDSKTLMRDFKAIVGSANKQFSNALTSPLTITLGDEFQGVIADLPSAIQIMLFIEEELIREKKAFKLRFVLYEGLIDTMINSKIAYEMLGPGLTEARKQLSALKNGHQRFRISLDDANIAAILNSSFLVLQLLTAGWKPEKDYDIAYNFIRYGDYKKVAEVLNKNRSLIWKRERTLNIESYNAVKSIIQTASKL